MKRAMTVLDLLEDTAARVPGKTAVIEGDLRVSYGELMARARTVGTAICKKMSGGGVPV